MSSNVRLALEWIPNTNHTGFYVAMENGYYADENLDVSLFMPNNHGDGREWLLNGQTEFAITEQMSLSDIFLKNKQAPLVAIAAMQDHNLSGLLTNHSINRPKDLTKGIYATFGYPTEQAIVRDTVNADGGDFKQTKIVTNNMIFDPVQDLADNKYNGILVYHHWEGVMAKQSHNKEKYHFYYVKDYVPEFDYYTPVIATNRNYLNEHGDIVRRFLKATRKGFEFAEAFPNEAAQTLMRYVPDRRLQEKLVVSSQEEISQHYRSKNGIWGKIDEHRWRAFYHWLNKQSMGEEIPEYIGFTNKYLDI
ncbi:ABC transporter substrate-binding protein [Lentilactobacillus raoultii]|uniref:ABC transporter substrate-binding protein n=1 Tax=Lentilactobacillus raoultii TaxID=1987503 RepID=A0ABW3PPR3_9LACO|nr:ABC transporter substrate-binding protein [Lentilactobacillus raoultii]